MRDPKLVTLTLKHNDAPLLDQAKRIKESFRRLRARAVWKQQVVGGFWVIEIIKAKSQEGFHVHIHAIIDSKFLPQDWLSREWHRITGDSYIVDIRRCPAKRARYVSKYIAKGSELTDNGQQLWEYYEAFHRRRDTNRFGACTDVQQPPSGLQFLGVVSNIIERARIGDPEALALIPIVETLLLRKIRMRERPD